MRYIIVSVLLFGCSQNGAGLQSTDDLPDASADRLGVTDDASGVNQDDGGVHKGRMDARDVSSDTSPIAGNGGGGGYDAAGGAGGGHMPPVGPATTWQPSGDYKCNPAWDMIEFACPEGLKCKVKSTFDGTKWIPVGSQCENTWAGSSWASTCSINGPPNSDFDVCTPGTFCDHDLKVCDHMCRCVDGKNTCPNPSTATGCSFKDASTGRPQDCVVGSAGNFAGIGECH